MKNRIIFIILVLLCTSLFTVFSSADDGMRYDIFVKQVLADFDNIANIDNIEAGGSQWGARWANTSIGLIKGLDNTANALSVKISEYNYGEDVILTGFECSYIGGNETYNSWTAGDYLIFRICNNTPNSFNITPALDVNDGYDSRVRIWVNGAQQLLDTDYNVVETKTEYALCSDGVNYGDLLCYTKIPENFDGWMLVPLSDYSMGIGDFECISNNNFPGIDWTQVMHLTFMVQFASKADFTIDSIALADAEIGVIEEVVVETEFSAEEVIKETQVEISPKTSDSLFLITFFVISTALTFYFIKNKKRMCN